MPGCATNDAAVHEGPAPSYVRLRENAAAVCAAAGGLLVIAWLGLHVGSWPDWEAESRPAVEALLRGDVLRFLEAAPAYGGSLVLRAPFMLFTKLWHGTDLALYTASAVPCLAAAGAFGVWLVARMRAQGSSSLARTVALLLCVANPLTIPALQIGHPEELLGAVLCVVAVLCALGDRPTWAAVALGLAVANKEWAVLALGPMLVALPRARLRALITTGVVAGAVCAPLLVAPLIRGSGGFVDQATGAGLNSGAIFQPWQIWWFLGSPAHTARGLLSAYRVAPAWVGTVAHPLVIAVMPPLTALYARRRRGRVRHRPNDVLLLLALLLALRCVLDPWDISYYCLPSLLALLSWETLTYTRPPVVTLGATFAAWFSLRETASVALDLSPDMQAMVFAAVSVAAIVALAIGVYAPGFRQRLASRSRRDEAVAATV